jgi:hypothetical protein
MSTAYHLLNSYYSNVILTNPIHKPEGKDWGTFYQVELYNQHDGKCGLVKFEDTDAGWIAMRELLDTLVTTIVGGVFSSEENDGLGTVLVMFNTFKSLPDNTKLITADYQVTTLGELKQAVNEVR